MSSKLPVIYTIGHSTHELSLFLKILQLHHVDTILDVRRFPGSRKYPHFGQDPLGESLKKENIGYHHLVNLGGRRRAMKKTTTAGKKRKRKSKKSEEEEEREEDEEKEEAANSLVVNNDGWENKSFQNYADYAATSKEFWKSIREIIDHWVLKEGNTCCIMCPEGLWWRCHRRIVADYLISTQQVRVVCIYPTLKLESDKDAPMTAFAVRVHHPQAVKNAFDDHEKERIVLAYPKAKESIYKATKKTSKKKNQ